MNKRQFEAYVNRAIAHAESRWLLGESDQVREWCERERNHARRTRVDMYSPADLVYHYAEKYGLEDPEAPWGIRWDPKSGYTSSKK